MKEFFSGVLLAFLVGLLGFSSLFRAESVEQPIQFNHVAHADMDCTGCHEYVTTDSFAGLPTLETCLICHETAITESPEEEKVRTLASQSEPVRWGRLFRQPAHVFYSHRRHVEVAGLECQGCHPEIVDATRPPSSVEKLTMAECIGCHEERGVKAGCVDCHR